MVKEVGVFDLPFLFNSDKEADAVLDGPLGDRLLKKLEAKGLVGLVYWENGFRNLTNSKPHVFKAEDLDRKSFGLVKSVSLRVYPGVRRILKQKQTKNVDLSKLRLEVDLKE